jgi:hypothetical protein
MYADWQAAARHYIAQIHDKMPDATVDELRKALRQHGSGFHCGTSWGKKVWAKRCKLYLLSLNPADIAFPWKGETTTTIQEGGE